jgi:hypothetical protein
MGNSKHMITSAVTPITLRVLPPVRMMEFILKEPTIHISILNNGAPLCCEVFWDFICATGNDHLGSTICSNSTSKSSHILNKIKM